MPMNLTTLDEMFPLLLRWIVPTPTIICVIKLGAVKLVFSQAFIHQIVNIAKPLTGRLTGRCLWWMGL